MIYFVDLPPLLRTPRKSADLYSIKKSSNHLPQAMLTGRRLYCWISVKAYQWEQKVAHFIKLVALTIAASSIMAPGFASAKDIVVQMKNQGAGGAMVFEPSFVQASVGDTVRFVPTDVGHNAETIKGMLPAGVEPSAGTMNKEFDLLLSKAGIYGVKCMPHFSMGMAAIIQAGKGPSPNIAAARAVILPPLAAKRLAPALAQAK